LRISFKIIHCNYFEDNAHVIVHGDDINDKAVEYYYSQVRDLFFVVPYGSAISTSNLIERIKESDSSKKELAKQDLK
jgi:hypothetical protein